MSTIKVNSDTIKGYKNYFDSEKNYFSNTSYYTLSNSYLSSCSDATVQSMYSNLNDIYSKINTLYNSINTYWEEYISDFNTLETSIETCDNVCTNASVSSYLSGFVTVLPEEDTEASDYEEKEAVNYLINAFYNMNSLFSSEIDDDKYNEMLANATYITSDYVDDLLDEKLGWKSIFISDDYDSTIHMIAVYSKAIDETYGTNISDEKKEEYMLELLKKDAENGYELLNSTPLLMEDTEVEMITQIKMLNEEGYEDYTYKGDVLYYFNVDGMEVTAPLGIIGKDEDGNMTSTDMTNNQKEEYIKVVTNYYIDIMSETDKYSTEYKEKTVGTTDKLVLVYIDDSNDEDEFDWQGKCYYHNFGKTCDVNIRMDTFYNLDTNTTDDYIYKYAIGSYNHEFGHAYDNSSRDGSYFTEKDTWQDIYKTIYENDSNYTYIRDYGHGSACECFAEVMAEYYNYDGTGDSMYDPEDLKMIEIDVTTKEGKHYTNLYDYIDQEIAN